MTVTPDGEPLKWTAVYDMHHSRYREEFDSAEDALGFLIGGEENGTLSSVSVLRPDGSVAFDEAQILEEWKRR